MKATEQLAAMGMMAVDPIARVVAPRFWAGVISMPLLAAMFSVMGVFGGYFGKPLFLLVLMQDHSGHKCKAMLILDLIL